MKFILTVNPHGGTKQGPLLLKKVKPIFDAAGVELFIIETTFAGHAQELANQLDLSAYDGFIGIGGDGTLHEITNQLLFELSKKKILMEIFLKNMIYHLLKLCFSRVKERIQIHLSGQNLY